jgi:hypothetical protein
MEWKGCLLDCLVTRPDEKIGITADDHRKKRNNRITKGENPFDIPPERKDKAKLSPACRVCQTYRGLQLVVFKSRPKPCPTQCNLQQFEEAGHDTNKSLLFRMGRLGTICGREKLPLEGFRPFDPATAGNSEAPLGKRPPPLAGV